MIGYSLNGKSFPATEPYVVEEDDWIAITYYNEGLQSHPMHLHQYPQLVFAKDGFPLDDPYWADTINIAPGERYTVLLQADTLGTWVWHCHILTHVEHDDGMFGMVTALIVTCPATVVSSPRQDREGRCWTRTRRQRPTPLETGATPRW